MILAERAFPVPESVLAREVFGPLGGVVEVGAVNSTGTWALPDVSMAEFLDRAGDRVRTLLDGVRVVCGFDDETMAIADELGYFRDHEVSAASLLLWSAGVTGVPQPLERLEEPAMVRRMCRMAADLQLVNLLQALVNAAVAGGTDAGTGAPRIARLLGTASDVADPTGACTPELVHRMWRVGRLPAILHPQSGAPEAGKVGYRAYDRELERLLEAV
ncbi:hypothetical protein [Streptomyces sp. NPDC093970]|uniref:hypothetical protein n=1 Tax=Streptomyces sp. NPDC093970 TaxID=3155076 RepID=UPI00341AE98B